MELVCYYNEEDNTFSNSKLFTINYVVHTSRVMFYNTELHPPLNKLCIFLIQLTHFQTGQPVS